MFDRDIDIRLRSQLRTVLQEACPEDEESLLARLNIKKNLNIIVTRVWPNPSRDPLTVNQFLSLVDLVDVVAASCFIPLWSHPALSTSIIARPEMEEKEEEKEGGRWDVIDGGVVAFMPPLGNVRLSPFPQVSLRSISLYLSSQLSQSVLIGALESPDVLLSILYNILNIPHNHHTNNKPQTGASIGKEE